MERFDVTIVGAGHGGAQAAVALRQLGFEGTIALIGDEPDLPYERPPLSKEYLSGAKPFERILLRPAGFWEGRGIALMLGRRVVEVDPAARRLRFEGGETLKYGTLVWAAGGAPRRLPCEGGDLVGVHSVRTRADVDRMVAELPTTRRAVVVGGGYIGLEAAAVLRRLGVEVTVLEAQDRVLGRVAGEPLSRFYEAEHRARGVDVRLGVQVARVEGEGGRATGVRLATGEFLPADMVVVGIGIVPAVEPLLAAGAAGGNGVDIDDHCRTTLPDVYAVGDCAAHENAFADGARVRVESVGNANDQAMAAARAIVGRPEPFRATPWFWSNQYDLKLQTSGLSGGHDDAVVRGEPSSRGFSVVYLRAGRVVAIDAVNATKDYIGGRKLVEAGASPPRDRLADPAVPLKELA